MTEPLIKTARLVLRRWQPADVDLWMAHLNTAAVTDHLGGVRSPEAMAERFEAMRAEWDERGYGFLAVEARASGQFLGACGLTTIMAHAAPAALQGAIQIGWIFRVEAWGQGYATEAATAMLDIGFDACGIQQIYAQTTERNPASCAIMTKLGMGRRADLDYHDPDYPARDNPTIIYAIDAAQWHQHRRQFQETM